MGIARRDGWWHITKRMDGKGTVNREDKQKNVKFEGEGRNYGADNWKLDKYQKKIGQINLVGSPWGSLLGYEWQFNWTRR